MELSFNLPHLVPGPVLVLNTNIINLLVKRFVGNVVSDKTAHIYGAYIFCGSANVQP